MPPSRPQDPRTLKIRDEEDQIKTLGPLSKPPGVDPNEAEATYFPGADATVSPGELEAPKPKSMVRGGAALTRPPVSDSEPATAPGKLGAGAIEAPKPAKAKAASSEPVAPRAAHEVPAVAPRHPTETVLRPRAEVKRKSSWLMWVFAFLVLGGIGFGVSWFLINPSSTGSAPEAANTKPEPTPEPVVADAGAKVEDDAAVEPDAAAAEVAAADGEPNAAPLPTEIAGVDAGGAADVQADAQAEVALAGAGPDVELGAGATDTTGDASPSSDTQLAAAPAGDAVAAVPAEADTTQPGPTDAEVAKVAPPVEVPRNPAESNRLNEAGLNARKAGDHARAMQLYQEALKFNPDSVWARYNLACELALAGRSKEAFAELTTLYKLGTPESRKALGAARKDSDFDSIRDSGQFFRLTNF
jgi:hypothetical protein